ncbi:MAG: HU family DNA-binding protein [Dehalococcoidales bacterium]|nr:HU family DNA-binding protein [Dehalococcoidales bacterium]
MTQSQLARAIAKEFFLPLVDATTLIDSILAKMTASLQKGEWVYFKDFGSFTKKTRPGHHVRHPKTGQLIWIPPRPDVDFNPAKGLLKAKRLTRKKHSF